MTLPTVTFNGATVGVCDTPHGLFGIRGLGLPPIRNEDTPRPASHGRYSSPDWADSRSIELDVRITGATAAELATNIAAFEAAFVTTPTELAMVWKIPGDPDRRALAKCRRRTKPIDDDYLYAFAATSHVEMVATDPRIYADTLSTATTPLAVTVGGLDFSAVSPFVFGSTGAGSTMAINNAGSFSTPWVATFYGPLVAPGLLHTGSGKRLSLSGGSLAAGDVLVLNSVDHSVLLNGTASRYSWLSPESQWFDLAAGANSVQLLGASGAGTVVIEWRSAWL